MRDVKRLKGKRRHPGRALLLLTQPTVILIVVILVLLHWRIPTQVQIELVVDQKTFTASTTDMAAVLRAINNQTILVREGKISYAKYPEIKAIPFTFPDRLEVEELEDFRIKEIAANTQHHTIRLYLEGIAKNIRIVSPAFLRDCRLTQFDTLKGSRWILVLGIMGWLAATIIGWYRLYGELKG
jgi:hypothetical protein